MNHYGNANRVLGGKIGTTYHGVPMLFQKHVRKLGWVLPLIIMVSKKVTQQTHNKIGYHNNDNVILILPIGHFWRDGIELSLIFLGKKMFY